MRSPLCHLKLTHPHQVRCPVLTSPAKVSTHAACSPVPDLRPTTPASPILNSPDPNFPDHTIKHFIRVSKPMNHHSPAHLSSMRSSSYQTIHNIRKAHMSNDGKMSSTKSDSLGKRAEKIVVAARASQSFVVTLCSTTGTHG